jgi:hypothetical protein
MSSAGTEVIDWAADQWDRLTDWVTRVWNE